VDLRRVVLIVLDSVGIGELPDAADFGDEGSNTLGNIVRSAGGIALPNLCRLGLGCINGIDYLPVPAKPEGSYGRMAEISGGKDTTTGHWEMMGLPLEKPFPVYPNGFPEEVIGPFQETIGSQILGNVPASGTEIIEELGAEHLRTGKPIVYTSADSVFQIAAHEAVVPVARLYQMCDAARKILRGPHEVGRVIARPFVGEPGRFKRTANRKDLNVKPTGPTLLDILDGSGGRVVGIGKIEDIFAGQGITEAVHTASNREGFDVTLEFVREGLQEDYRAELFFTNLVDFDMLYGHRNNVTGYKEALEYFDSRLPELLNALEAGDLLIVTADHGNDPTTPSTDHSREYIPLILKGKSIEAGVNLATRLSFSDLANTLAEAFHLDAKLPGASFWRKIHRR
jgi:phosphopentomutase